MQVIALRFVTMRGVATAMTFVFVHSDKDVLLVPLLDAVGSLVAVLLVFVELKKENIAIRFPVLRRRGKSCEILLFTLLQTWQLPHLVL